MTKLTKLKFVQNEKLCIFKCADSKGNRKEQQSRFVKVTLLPERKKKKIFEYISLWQAIRSLLSRQYSLGFSQGQNG
jgi:hypothetical protein